MSTIGTTNSAAGDALTSLLRSSSAAGAYRTSPQSSETRTSAKIGEGPAVVVDLSDNVKALYERTKVAQAVADKLQQQIAASKGDGKQAQVSKPKSDDAAKVFDVLSGGSASRGPSETKWEAGSKWGDPTKSDQEFISDITPSLLSQADALDKNGYPPQIGQAIRDAVANGTLKVQKGSDVPDLNMTTTTTYTTGPGGGQGMSNSISSRPTGDTKAALNEGRAYAMWTADRGNVYISW